MSSNNQEKKKFKLDKQSGANLVLAFTFVCFMFTMFMASNQIGTSYAVDTSSSTPPAKLTFSGELFQNKDGITANAWKYMSNNLPLLFNFKAVDDNNNSYDLYCIEGQIGVSGDTSVSYINPTPMSSSYAPGLAYILNNAYPNVKNNSYMNVCTDDSCKKYVTQYAVWYYLDLMGVKDTNGDTQLMASEKSEIESLSAGDNAYAKIVISLANAAKTYNANVQAEPIISINKNNIQYTVTDDGKYLISNEIAVTSDNRSDKFKSYTVGITDNNCDAKIIDVNGNETSSFSRDAKFKVRVPIEKLNSLNTIDLGLNVIASFDKDTVYAYTPSINVGEEQRPIIATYTSTSTNANIALKINLAEITKEDIATGKPVEGAVLSIVDANGKEIVRWTTSTTPHYVNLAAGNYTLTEISSPDGYELNTEAVPFTVAADGTIAKVVMKNTPTIIVPDTAENISIYLYIIGAMILVIGVGVIYATTRPNKNK